MLLVPLTLQAPLLALLGPITPLELPTSPVLLVPLAPLELRVLVGV